MDQDAAKRLANWCAPIEKKKRKIEKRKKRENGGGEGEGEGEKKREAPSERRRVRVRACERCWCAVESRVTGTIIRARRGERARASERVKGGET